MGVGEIYIKLVTTFPKDPKVRMLAQFGADAGLARDLYVQMCLYCKEMLSDGFVPAWEIGHMVHPLDQERGNQLAKQLASVGLTKEVSKNEAQGWQVLAYLKRNGSKEDVERLSQVRAEAGRAGGKKSRKRPAQRASQANRKQVANQVADTLPSNADSVSDSVESGDRVIQEPTVPAGAGAAGGTNGLSITQRAKRITDAYDAAVPMCKWPAINAIVIRAIKTERWADDAILAALIRHVDDNRPVTIDSLRTELDGIAPSQRNSTRPSTTDRAVAEGQALKAKLAARAQEAS
jgi:hypothetical protein